MRTKPLAQRPYAIGIDVGGTKIAAGVLDRTLDVVAICITKEHAGQSPAHVVDAIEKLYWETLRQAHISPEQVAGVGVSFAGHTLGRNGLVLTSSNLPEWHHMPLRDVVAKRLKQLVVLDNDTNFGAVAEHRYGAGKGASDMVYVTFSTGVGMGIIIDGRLYQGHTGTAGELGHTVVEVDGRRCTCGTRGCLMAYASGIALRSLAWERIQAGEDTALRELTWDDPQLISGEAICETARKGDPVAQDLIISTGRYLGIGLASVVQVLNPEVIVVGGGLTSIGSTLLDPCLESLHQHIPPVLWDSYRVVPGRFQTNVSVVGAAASAFCAAETSKTGEAAKSFVAPVAVDAPAAVPVAKALTTVDRLALERVEGTVFDIQSYSLDDGPGLRTSVFLKGCPLRCHWCCNPESLKMQPELLMLEANCLACGICTEVCGSEALSLTDGRLVWDRVHCTSCGECAQVCPAQAMTWSGRRASAGSVIQEVLRDTPFYENGGGLTLTGGEATLQPLFAEALLRLAKAEGLNTAIETTANAPWETLEILFPYLDLWLVDLKHMDSREHRNWTGLGNELILSNLRKLGAAKAKMRVRIPLIPTANLTEENLRASAEFALGLGATVQSIDLLPYHKLGRAKYQATGRQWWEADLLTDEDVQSAAELIRSYNLTVHIVGNSHNSEERS
jgi:pyruvate formate lyase activating enzyme